MNDAKFVARAETLAREKRQAEQTATTGVPYGNWSYPDVPLPLKQQKPTKRAKSMDKASLYQSLYEAYIQAYYPEKTKRTCQEELVKKWNAMKDSPDVVAQGNELLNKLKAISLNKKGALLKFWGKQATKKNTELPKEGLHETPTVALLGPTMAQNSPSTSGVSQPTSTRIPEAQLKIKAEIDLLLADLVGLFEREKKGLLTEEQEQTLRRKKAKKLELEKELKRKIDDQKRQKKARDNRKAKLQAAIEKNPDLQKTLNVRHGVGRPRLEDDQPLLLKTIVDIAMHGSASHERRQSDVYRSVRTLSDLTDELKKDGFTLSRSGLYLRLLPKRSSSCEGQRHVSTVPVKLLKARNDQHEKHIDGKFCTSTITHLEELSSILGPSEVCFISQDDKARVPIGLTAANKQSPLIMHVEYKVSLPDHDWVIASKHKLVPSVYAAVQIKPNCIGEREAVGYSGPTYVAIRSGKHASSTPLSHGLDFERLLGLEEFTSFTRVSANGPTKPILVMTVDGGPDENPRYQKVIQAGVHHFVRQNLDALFIATNAPGRSAFNRVERKMSFLSKELTGLILPHDQYGSHLDAQGKTTDFELEKQNFGFAGKTLGEIWSRLVIDKFPTVAKYIDPDFSEVPQDKLELKNQKWYDHHVRVSQYVTQIIKCNSTSGCCSNFRSSYLSVVPGRFLPPPIPLLQTPDGLKVHEDGTENENYKFPSLFASMSMDLGGILPEQMKKFRPFLPYDLFCPSIQSIVNDRICKVCHTYFASLTMLKKHSAQHKGMPSPSIIQLFKRIKPIDVVAHRQDELMVVTTNGINAEAIDWVHADDVDLSDIPSRPWEEEQNDELPILSIKEHFSSPWEESAAQSE